MRPILCLYKSLLQQKLYTEIKYPLPYTFMTEESWSMSEGYERETVGGNVYKNIACTKT